MPCSPPLLRCGPRSCVSRSTAPAGSNDGWRMLAFTDGSRVRLISRQNVDHTERFRELAAAIAALKAPTLILDGQVCVFDKGLISQQPSWLRW